MHWRQAGRDGEVKAGGTQGVGDKAMEAGTAGVELAGTQAGKTGRQGWRQAKRRMEAGGRDGDESWQHAGRRRHGGRHAGVRQAGKRQAATGGRDDTGNRQAMEAAAEMENALEAGTQGWDRHGGQARRGGDRRHAGRQTGRRDLRQQTGPHGAGRKGWRRQAGSMGRQTGMDGASGGMRQPRL
ncbi:uncharacterized protein LOC119578603 [Penaeus monodon]|uniref:uncharacterized protein LOC119578603 n=1 Tax=Penaeus monodon TaxID=6687 RepID=UPI0018A721E8|nr:uncharacterized protein LOC119578603 [Penaeus monodon]